MRSAYYVVNRMLQRTGVVEGLPRILNHETGGYVLGYTEINTMATTPFSRTKTHKAWFAGDSAITDGDLIEDRVDGNKYIVMSLKAEYSGGLVAYLDGTLYLASAVCDIHRFDDTVTNTFGRTVQDFELLHSDVPIMVNPLNLDAESGEDKMIDSSRIKIAIQAKYAVKEGDRLAVGTDDMFIVRSIDKYSLNNIFTLHVEKDTR